MESQDEVQIHWKNNKELWKKLPKVYRKRLKEDLKKAIARVKNSGTPEVLVAVFGPQEEMLTEDKVNKLLESARNVPRWLWRTYSILGLYRSVGFSSRVLYLPYAHTRLTNQYQHIRDIPVQKGAMMLAFHLKWQDCMRIDGEFLSWTDSLLFALEHAFGRHEKGQHPVIVAGGEAYKLQAPDGSPIPIFSAIALHQAFDIRRRLRESGPKQKNQEYKIHERRSTHERVALGEAHDREGAVEHVELEDLVSNGLLCLAPDLKVDGLFTRTGLSERLDAQRTRNFRNIAQPEPITNQEILISFRLAKLYERPFDNGIPPLAAVLCFLSLKKRPVASDNLDAFMRMHYKAEDIDYLHHDGIEFVPDNLQEVEQYVALLQRSQVVFGVNPINEIILLGGYGLEDHTVLYAEEDRRKERETGRKNALTEEERDKDKNALLEVMKHCYDSPRRMAVIASKLMGKRKKEQTQILRDLQEHIEVLDAYDELEEEQKTEFERFLEHRKKGKTGPKILAQREVEPGKLDVTAEQGFGNLNRARKRKLTNNGEADQGRPNKRTKLLSSSLEEAEKSDDESTSSESESASADEDEDEEDDEDSDIEKPAMKQKSTNLQKGKGSKYWKKLHVLLRKAGQMQRAKVSRVKLQALHEKFVRTVLPALVEEAESDDWMDIGSITVARSQSLDEIELQEELSPLEDINSGDKETNTEVAAPESTLIDQKIQELIEDGIQAGMEEPQG